MLSLHVNLTFIRIPIISPILHFFYSGGLIFTDALRAPGESKFLVQPLKIISKQMDTLSEHLHKCNLNPLIYLLKNRHLYYQETL